MPSVRAPRDAETKNIGIEKRRRKLALPVVIFLVSLVFPFLFQIGPLQLSANRLVLLVLFLPCLLLWLRGRAGPILTADIALLLMWFWFTISFLVIHGAGAIVEPSGITLIETIGPFLLARCFVKDAESFRAAVALLFAIIVAMLPFAVYETLTGRNILLEFASSIWFSGHDAVKDPRWGLDRVEGVMGHPILFGVFCGGPLALIYYVLCYGASRSKRLLKTGLVGVTASLSLSSGPLTALAMQVMLISWDRFLKSVRSRWKILAGGVLSLVVAIELAANRSTPEIFIAYFAFNRRSANNRLNIWEYGTQSVANHPLFGIGRNDWERAPWMTSSMDMFWLVPAVRSGLPAAILLQVAFFSLFFSVALKGGLDDRTSHYRTGYLITMVAFYVAGWTVDYWKTVYVFFLFLLGSGAWILSAPENTSPSAESTTSIKGRVGKRRSGRDLSSVDRATKNRSFQPLNGQSRKAAEQPVRRRTDHHRSDRPSDNNPA